MSDMFDVYNHVRAQGLSRALQQNKAEAQAIIDELAEERDDALRQVDCWRAHYVAEQARAEYLMGLLDEVYDGPENNPARATASDSITMPRGAREGEFIQKHDRVYLVAMKKYIKEKVSYVGSWRKLIKDFEVFGTAEEFVNRQ